MLRFGPYDMTSSNPQMSQILAIFFLNLSADYFFPFFSRLLLHWPDRYRRGPRGGHTAEPKDLFRDQVSPALEQHADANAPADFYDLAVVAERALRQRGAEAIGPAGIGRFCAVYIFSPKLVDG